MSDPREDILIKIKEGQEVILVRPGLGGDLLRALISMVKDHGSLKVWITFLLIPFTTIWGILMVKQRGEMFNPWEVLHRSQG